MAVLTLHPLGGIARFFTWWFGELAALVPAALKRRFASAADRIVLMAADGTATLYRESGGTMTPLERVDLAAEGEAARRIVFRLRQDAFGRAVTAGKLGICLRIPAEHALRTVFDLPSAAAANLAEVVSFELDRHTPFRAEQVLFAARILEHDPTAQRIRVETLLVPRSTVAEMMDVAARLHLEVDRIDIAAASGAGAASDNLLRADMRSASGRGYRRLVAGLAATAAALAIAAVVVPVLRAEHAAAALERRFAELKRVALKEAQLETEVGQLRKSELFLIEKKRNMPSVSALLFETTRLLPDNTWLTDWQLTGREVQLQGVSASASSVVGLIEQSHVFDHTTFLSPVTQDGAGREHFQIATQVVGGSGS